MWQSLLVGTFICLTFTISAFSAESSKVTDAQSTEATIPVEIEKASKDMFGVDPRNKFSLYQPSYFVFGKENLKMQFSGKYRVAKSYNLYLAYTQTMFWNIYDQSAPFDDINYNPEVFYRLVEEDLKFVRSIDFGVLHTSNGEDSNKSRSLNRIFLKTNFVTAVKRHTILGDFKLQHIYSKSDANDKIVDHMGYWELKLTLTHVLVHNSQRLDIEYRFFAGKNIVDIGKGGRELGLVYRLGSDNFNPAFYLQYYSGYAESLLHYDQKVSQVRLGLLLFF
jgi:phospholipase A1